MAELRNDAADAGERRPGCTRCVPAVIVKRSAVSSSWTGRVSRRTVWRGLCVRRPGPARTVADRRTGPDRMGAGRGTARGVPGSGVQQSGVRQAGWPAWR